VAAIAGALLGARWGMSAVPARWRRILHGWPGLRSRDLVRLALLTARGGDTDSQGWPACDHLDYGLTSAKGLRHPADEGVILGTVATRDSSVDAVVSLCRTGNRDVMAESVRAEDHVEFWLIDTDRADNPNLSFVIDDAARTVRDLRQKGRHPLLHCVRCESRTPTVAARYGMLFGSSASEAKQEISELLGSPGRNPALWEELDRF
jgi:ADP-ribosyl-[dinitrogen reductase] hydrolase